MSTRSSLLASTSVYDQAVAILRARYFDQRFRENELDRLAVEFQPTKDGPNDLATEREALTRLLSHIPATHLAVFSEASFRYLLGELNGEMRPTFGLQALRWHDEYFTFFVLEDGPAQQAGIVPWERIVSIDGVPPEKSPRLDYQQKDAYLPVDRDPPIHSLLCAENDEISLLLERTSGQQRKVKVRARPYSALAAARASVHTLEEGGHRMGQANRGFDRSSIA